MSIFLKLFFQDIELIYRNRKKLFKGNFSFSYLGLIVFSGGNFSFSWVVVLGVISKGLNGSDASGWIKEVGDGTQLHLWFFYQKLLTIACDTGELNTSNLFNFELVLVLLK